MGVQDVYTTEGIRWQIKREWQHDGNWTFEEIIALAKLKFTGNDCSKEASGSKAVTCLKASRTLTSQSIKTLQ